LIYLYMFALVLGGVLLASSLILGGHGDAHGGEVHAADGGHDAEGGPESFLVAFLSMRFWTFFLAFFGLTGVVLDGLGLVSSSIIAGILSFAMGGGAGYTAVWALKRLRSDEANSAAGAKDYVGKSGRVLVAFGPGETGKVRLEVRGSTVDLLAVTEDDTSFTSKDEVIVVEMDGTRAKVAKLTADRLPRD
jgi:membrane protein implicated in regulation of membrane protease activity